MTFEPAKIREKKEDFILFLNTVHEWQQTSKNPEEVTFLIKRFRKKIKAFDKQLTLFKIRKLTKTDE